MFLFSSLTVTCVVLLGLKCTLQIKLPCFPFPCFIFVTASETSPFTSVNFEVNGIYFVDERQIG